MTDEPIITQAEEVSPDIVMGGRADFFSVLSAEDMEMWRNLPMAHLFRIAFPPEPSKAVLPQQASVPVETPISIAVEKIVAILREFDDEDDLAEVVSDVRYELGLCEMCCRPSCRGYCRE